MVITNQFEKIVRKLTQSHLDPELAPHWASTAYPCMYSARCVITRNLNTFTPHQQGVDVVDPLRCCKIMFCTYLHILPCIE